jgi:hypothetical protein
LKPILTAENMGTMSTYHLQYWTRHHPVKPPSSSTKRTNQGNDEESKMDALSLEIKSRHLKTKEWASDNKVLGSTGKTNVTRPRALIAVSSSKLNDAAAATTNAGSDNSSITKKQERAALWKSRIYCDQAYQCYMAVVESWQASSASTSATPSSVQPHLLKLTKCFGISVQTVLVDTGTSSSSAEEDTIPDESSKQFRNQYSVDATVLELLFKLPKGKVLLARVLEQALLPPAVVQVLLPVALSISFAGTSNTDADTAYADDRVLGSLTAVIATLPDLSGNVIIDSVQRLIRQSSSTSSSILSSTTTMQCTHALLQRGAVVAANDTVFAKEWQITEIEFLNLLSGM